MRAIRVHEHGGPERLVIEDLPIPKIQPNEVLVEVKSTSLNHLDLFVRGGIPGVKMPLPLVMGSDASGVIREIGRLVTQLKVGDRVLVVPGYGCGECVECHSGRENYCAQYAIAGEHANGVQAEFLALDHRRVIRIPAATSFEEAAAMPLVFLTAWEMVVNKANVHSGQSVLVWGASSGVGSAAVQIARARGAQVITTVGSAEKAAKAARMLTVDHVIDYRTQDVVKEVRAITNGRGADIVIDHVGVTTFEKSLRVLAKGGKLVFCGATTGAAVSFDLRFVFFKQQSLIGSTMGNRGDLFRALELVERGELHGVVDRVFEVDQIRAAHEHLESGKQFGKVIVRFAR